MPWPHDVSRPNFYGLGLGDGIYGLGLERPGLNLGRGSCTDNFFGKII